MGGVATSAASADVRILVLLIFLHRGLDAAGDYGKRLPAQAA
jgi:hypothetical protein